MQLVVAIIQPTKLSTVRDALLEIGLDDFTVCDAMGYGRQHGQTASFRGNEYRVDLLRKVALEIPVPFAKVDQVLQILKISATTGTHGQIGDGKIFVLPVAETYDIQTGQSEAGGDEDWPIL